MSRFSLCPASRVGTAVPACPERSRRSSPAARRPEVLRDRGRWFLAAILSVGLITLVSASRLSASDCLPIHEAEKHVGETKCVAGKVLKIKVGTKGVHFLDFCEDHMACPFTVVVFASALKDVGDVRHFEGRTIEIRGPVKLYDGRAEIILNRISQVTGGAAMIPPLPKTYDVENRGHFSAGRVRPAKKPAKTKAKPSATATYGNDVEGEQPRE